MSLSQAASTLGKLGAETRHQRRREPILETARKMWIDQGKQPPAGLYPPLTLTAADRI